MLQTACRRLGAATANALPCPAVRSCASAAGATGGARRVWRWGGAGGMMGKEDAQEATKEPKLEEEHRGVQLIAVGASHSAFVVDRRLYTYGSNKHQQLGRGAADVAEPAAIDSEDLPPVVQVALGGHHSAAITESGELWTWGWGGSFWYGAGGLGQGTRDAWPSPARVERFVEMEEKVTAVACGAQHSLVLTASGGLFATGKGDFGRLGRGDTRDELHFEEIDYFTEAFDSILEPDVQTTIKKIGCGNNFSAVLSTSGELWVWGRNDQGQMGLGEEAMGDMYSAERYPRLVRNLSAEGVRIVDFACGEHAIIVCTESGDLYQWGGRTWLEPHRVSIPVQYAESLSKVVKVAAGDKFNFALSADGTLYSWGSKSSGCLALGEECAKQVVEPTPVSAETFGHQKVVDIVASKSRCLAITAEDEYVS